MTSKASWQVLFAGMIFAEGIIFGGTFLCRGMHFAEENHLCSEFSLRRDDYYGRKSSLGELFPAEG